MKVPLSSPLTVALAKGPPSALLIAWPQALGGPWRLERLWRARSFETLKRPSLPIVALRSPWAPLPWAFVKL